MLRRSALPGAHAAPDDDVNGTTTTAQADGLTWATSVARIQVAVDLAASGDHIWVASGSDQMVQNTGL